MGTEREEKLPPLRVLGCASAANIYSALRTRRQGRWAHSLFHPHSGHVTWIKEETEAHHGSLLL